MKKGRVQWSVRNGAIFKPKGKDNEHDEWQAIDIVLGYTLELDSDTLLVNTNKYLTQRTGRNKVETDLEMLSLPFII